MVYKKKKNYSIQFHCVLYTIKKDLETSLKMLFPFNSGSIEGGDWDDSPLRFCSF